MNVSVLLCFRFNRGKSTDELTFLPSLRFSHCVQIIEIDEVKNSGIISVDGCKRGVVGAEILALARSCENGCRYPNRGLV